jgi:RNA polymerase sigma factor (sigma-70 family)
MRCNGAPLKDARDGDCTVPEIRHAGIDRPDIDYELTQGFAASYIRRKAREIARQPGFSPTDREDLRQQLCVRVLERLPQFDPNQGCFNAFVKLIVKQFASDCRRHQRAQRRDRRGDASLNILVEGEEGPLELAQTIGRRELNARLKREERPAEETIDLAHDLASVLATLPPRLRTIAERLKDLSASQIAIELNVHSSTVYRDMHQLRERFANAGFQEFPKSMRRLGTRRRTSPNSKTKCGEQNSAEKTPAMPCCSHECDRRPMNGSPVTAPSPVVNVSFLVHEPAETYHAKTGEFLTSHLLGDFRKCPLLFHRKRQGQVLDREDCPAYLVGRAAHTVILEGDEAFRQRYAVGGPVNPRTGLPYGAGTKAWAEWAQTQGKEALTEQQHALVTSLATSVKQHAEARRLLAEGMPEAVVRTRYCDLSCQIRMDWFEPHQGVVDLKTCDDLTWFEADARRYGYAHQLAFYRAVLAQVIGLYMPVHLIAVEKKEPYRCGVWRISPEVLAAAQKENEQAIDRLHACQASGSFPTGYEETRQFDYL